MHKWFIIILLILCGCAGNSSSVDYRNCKESTKEIKEIYVYSSRAVYLNVSLTDGSSEIFQNDTIKIEGLYLKTKKCDSYIKDSTLLLGKDVVASQTIVEIE